MNWHFGPSPGTCSFSQSCLKTLVTPIQSLVSLRSAYLGLCVNRGALQWKPLALANPGLYKSWWKLLSCPRQEAAAQGPLVKSAPHKLGSFPRSLKAFFSPGRTPAIQKLKDNDDVWKNIGIHGFFGDSLFKNMVAIQVQSLRSMNINGIISASLRPWDKMQSQPNFYGLSWLSRPDSIWSMRLNILYMENR